MTLRGLQFRLGGAILRTFLIITLIAIFTLAKPTFLSFGNAYALLQSVALVGLVALGLALTMIAGEFDLGVGSMLAVAGLVTITLSQSSMTVGVIVALALGLGVGLANALVVHKLDVSSLVVTVGTMMVLSGMAFWLAGGKVITTDNFDPGFALDEPILRVFSLRSLITFLVFAITALMIRYTLVGRDIRAVGSKRWVAAASGANVGIALASAFAMSSLCAALAGSLLSMSLASASATTASSIMLQAVSAAIVGGVSLSGGVGSIGGILAGTFVLAIMNNGLSLIGMGSTGILFANGIILLLVVLMDGSIGEFFHRHIAKGLQTGDLEMPKGPPSQPLSKTQITEEHR